MDGATAALQGSAEAGGKFRWTWASRSHVGLVREINEDACLDHPGLWAVADGMGGRTAGDFASRMVIEALRTVGPHRSLENSVAEARGQLQTVNQRLRAEAASRSVHMIGSTVVVLLARDGCCTCLWAGDSRIYLYRDRQLRLLTRDHSQCEELRSRGFDLTDDLYQRARHVITRAVGALDTLDLDEATVEVQDGDVFLLCSDGLSNAVSEMAIRSALLPGNCQRASEALVEMALEEGGYDNISAIVVRAEDLCGDQTMLNPAL